MINTRGFTLIELVLTMTILGVLSLGFIGFIGIGSNVYTNVSGRDAIASDARFVIERFNREIRNALPNSIRILNDTTMGCLEYLPIKSTNVYLDIPTAGETTRDNIVVIKSSVPYNKVSGDRVVVYPLMQNDGYKKSNNKAETVASVDLGFDSTSWEIKLTQTQIFASDSPNERLFIIGKPVSFCLLTSSGQLYRYSNYGFNGNQKAPSTDGVLMAENIFNGNMFPFEFGDDGLNSGMVKLNLIFSKNSETVAFSHGVHIKNVP